MNTLLDELYDTHEQLKLEQIETQKSKGRLEAVAMLRESNERSKEIYVCDIFVLNISVIFEIQIYLLCHPLFYLRHHLLLTTKRIRILST